MDHTTSYAILDFKAVVKHSYYGASTERDAIYCEKTDRRFPRWQTAAQGLLNRYIEPVMANNTPRNLLVAHDMGTEYRSALFPDYKASRKTQERSPVEVEQVDLLYSWAKKFFTALGATQIGVQGVEADDVIAWLCQRITYPKDVYTVDADLLQLCNDTTIVYLKNEAHFGEGEYKGIPYNLTSIAKSILGDSSDEYPGVKGIGPVKFTELLEKYGPDGVLELQQAVDTGDTTALDGAIEATGDKILIKLRNSFGEWRTMWRLASLHPELCWKPRGRKLITSTIHKRIPHPQKLYDLLTAAQAADLWDTVFSSAMPNKIAVTAENWQEMREAILAEIAAGDICAFDYESSNKEPVPGFAKASVQGENFVDVLSQEMAGASFHFGKHLENVIYIPVDHKDSANLDKAVIRELLEFAGRKTRLVAHNAFFEGVVTQTNLGVELRGVHDTRLMQRYYNENHEAGLKSLSKLYLDYDQATYEETIGDKANMSELTLEEVFDYGADDAQVTGHLYDLLKLLLQLDEQWGFYERWAVDPTVVLQHSYVNGVDINWALQKRTHERDLRLVEEGMAELRQILEANVTGHITEGCKSFIEAEQEFVLKSTRSKLEKDGLSKEDAGEKAREKLYEWKTNQERACQYQPYREELVMPSFALTEKQLNTATAPLGLPPVTGVTARALGEYLGQQGMLGFEPPRDKTPEQIEFLTALANAVERGALKVRQLETKAEEEGDKFVHQAEVARKAFDELGAVVQSAAGVQPKLLTFGDELNVGSPLQMQQLLYCKIGVPVRLFGKNAGKGRLQLGIKNAGPSTDETAVMTALANDIEKGSWQEKALKVLLKIKAATTRISLYHDKYPLWRHKDGKIHPSFTDAGTDTRRPTGSSPNVLQVSKKDKVMRSMFVPPHPDWVCVAIDYNGQELRLLACESQDPVMIDAYDPQDEKDLHSVTGSGIAKLKAGKTGDKGMAQISEFRAFDAARSDESHPLNKLASAVRKHAKGCIAAGSLVLTDKGLVPIDFVTLDHKVWDGVEFVTHEGVEYKGEQEVITVGPLTATPDHEVFLNDGNTIPLGAYATQQDGPGLAVGEVAGVAARYADSYLRELGSVRGAQRGSDGASDLLEVRGGQEAFGDEPAQGSDQAVQVSAEKVVQCGAQEPCGSVLRNGSAVQQPQVPLVQELRGEGDHLGVHHLGSLRHLDAGEPSPQGLPGCGHRQDRQQPEVRTWEPSLGTSQAESVQYQEEPGCGVPGGLSRMGPSLGSAQDGSSGVPLRAEDGTPLSGEGNGTGADSVVPQAVRGRAKVYDIVNAGPRHRFTVSGVIVHNCNFGLAYGAGASTLSRNLIVPQDEAQELLDGAMALYARIPQWQQETAQFMEKNGYTLTAFGTKRHATEDIFSRDNGKVSRQHRQGTNATIQGTAAEMLRIVLTGIVERDLLHSLRMVFFAPIYDETVAFVHRDDVVEYCRNMHEIMQGATPPQHAVLQQPELSIGCDWGRVHELGRWADNTPETINAMVERCIEEGREMWTTDMQIPFDELFPAEEAA